MSENANIPVIAIVGRPNVGKSTLFNRILGKQQAVTADWAGTTRDRLYARTTWNSTEFILVDTAGIESEGTAYTVLDEDVKEQVLVALDEADLIVFIVDASVGPTKDDDNAIRMVQKAKKPFIVAANKYDSEKYLSNLSELHRLGASEITPISALTGRNMGDLMDGIVTNLKDIEPQRKVVIDNEEGINVAIAGRPNVGKSSLFNALIGKKLAIISDIAGTTRDFTISSFEDERGKINFIDTAGIRRRGKVGDLGTKYEEGKIEKYSVLRSFRAVEDADIVLILIDPTEGLTSQDLHIAGFAADQAKGVVIVVNKWDAIDKDETDMQNYLAYLHNKISFLPFAPVVFVSAKTSKNIEKIPDVVFEVTEARARRIPTSELNLLIGADILKKSPPAKKNVLPKINYITQADINPPTFIFFSSHPEHIHFSYKRYLENRIRDHWDFSGTAIRLVFKKKNAEYNKKSKKKK
ncbi:MAG: ribosome biogenesis GTPase Der [bacterium]